MSRELVLSGPCVRTQVVHRLPGRTRIRVPKSHRSVDSLAATSQAIQALPGVHRVEINRVSGSLLVHHEENILVSPSLEGPAGLLIDLVPPLERNQVVKSSSILGRWLRLFFGRLDARLLEATSGWIDLKMLVPLAFLGAAALQLTLTESTMAALSPLILLYAALDLYTKFHELFPGKPAGEPAR
jgi:heavy-metal-associated domain-containing protein